jgi:hypothetical protein
MQRPSHIAHLRKRLRRNLELAGGLLNESAGAAGARALHKHLLTAGSSVALEENGLHIFPADFTDETNLGMKFLNSRGNGHDFLHYFSANQRSHQARA